MRQEDRDRLMFQNKLITRHIQDKLTRWTEIISKHGRYNNIQDEKKKYFESLVRRCVHMRTCLFHNREDIPTDLSLADETKLSFKAFHMSWLSRNNDADLVMDLIVNIDLSIVVHVGDKDPVPRKRSIPIHNRANRETRDSIHLTRDSKDPEDGSGQFLRVNIQNPQNLFIPQEEPEQQVYDHHYEVQGDADADADADEEPWRLVE